MTTLKLPGLLSDKNKVLKDDERVDKRLLAMLAPFGFDARPPEIPLNSEAPYEDCAALGDGAEGDFEGLMSALFANVTPIEGIDRSTVTIKGVDDNDIDLFIHKPKNQKENLPSILHLHGGGMTILTAQTDCYPHWRDALSEKGLVVVGVDFRNAAGKLGRNPYPAGLNDCMSALEWLNNNKDELGVSKVIVSGESGGGNLSLALSLKAKNDMNGDFIQGTYAMCPYIYGDYGKKIAELPSLTENDGYFLDVNFCSVLASVYNPGKSPSDDYLAWPYWAEEKDLQGLSPHVISVNELDPLRDEGLAYFRKLVNAGVNSYSRTVNGTTHAADGLAVKSMPEVWDSTLRDIKGFAETL